MKNNGKSVINENGESINNESYESGNGIRKASIEAKA